MAKVDDLILKSERVIPQELSSYKCRTEKSGRKIIPYKLQSGNYCHTYQFIDSENRSKCFRVWRNKYKKSNLENLQLFQRLKTIKEFITAHQKQLPYFVGFNTYEKALADDNDINGYALEPYPGMVMDWVEGEMLNDFIVEEDTTQAAIASVANQFIEMCQCFHRLGISHGDLSYSNIMITPDVKLLLVDYDSVCVPGMEGKYLQFTGGVPQCQHPLRVSYQKQSKLTASNRDDNFSQIVLYLNILAYAKDLKLREFRESGELFCLEDFKDMQMAKQKDGLNNIPICKRLAQIGDKDIDYWVLKLWEALQLTDLSKIQGIVELYPLSPNQQVRLQKQKETPKSTPSRVWTQQPVTSPPTTNRQEFNWSIVNELVTPKPTIAKYCTNCGYKFPSTIEKYCHQCGYKRQTLEPNAEIRQA